MDTSKLDLDALINAAAEDDSLGFCIACGAEAFGVEPDAQNYRCAECDSLAVYGAEELLFHVSEW